MHKNKQLLKQMPRAIIFALLFNSIAPVIASNVSNGTKVLLCTSEGYRWVDLDTQQISPEDTDVRCAFCLPPQDDNLADFILSDTQGITVASANAQRPSAKEIYFGNNLPAFYALTRAPPASKI